MAFTTITSGSTKPTATHITELSSAVSTLATNANLTVSLDGIVTTGKINKENVKLLQVAVNSLETSFSGNCCEANCCQTSTCQTATCQSTKCQSASCQYVTCQSTTCQSTSCQSKYTPSYYCSCSCLLKGTTILIVKDGKIVDVPVETVKAGDKIVGANGIINNVTLAKTSQYHHEVEIYGIANSNIRITGHHQIFFKRDGKQQWGVFSYDYYKERIENTDDNGLSIAQKEFIEDNPNATMRIPCIAVPMNLEEEFATVNGWEKRKAFVVPAEENETLYTIQADGSHTMIAGGILIGAANDARYDYDNMPVEKIVF